MILNESLCIGCINMKGANDSKTLLQQFNKVQYDAFSLNEDQELSLPVASIIPGIIASKRKDVFKKTLSHPNSTHHVKFITKNEEAHAFLWQSSPQKIKEAVRWGIIKTQSITSHVISTLGNYRVIAHKRVAKGLISNSQIEKLKLLDLFQDRFEALQNLESLVNKANPVAEFEVQFANYMQKLTTIKNGLDAYFTDIQQPSGINTETLQQIKKDIDDDIERAKSYLDSLKTQEVLNPQNRARGEHSILTFVKEQMIHGLYELQGINQDMTYSLNRPFAMTRGDLNDLIEDARKKIDDHEADLRNAVTEKHHGLFSNDVDSLISYDFSADALTTDKQRDALLAISFIEKWDNLDTKTLRVQNESGSEPLEIYAATNWRTHKTWNAFFKSVGSFFINFFKSFVVPTQTAEVEDWENKDFHLAAVALRQQVAPTKPLWQKIVNFFKEIGHTIVDIGTGYHDVLSQIDIHWPVELLNDWNACDEVSSLTSIIEKAELKFNDIKLVEEKRLDETLKFCNQEKTNPNASANTSNLATVEYALSTVEQNDILTLLAKGLKDLTSSMHHGVYVKDPIAGMMFTAGFALGSGAILMPKTAASIFGSSYVNWISDFAYSVSSTQTVAALSGGSTQAQILNTVWEGIIYGPNGPTAKSIVQIGRDPLKEGLSVVSGLGIGYVLVNGIGGYPIPEVSQFLQAHMGTSPSAAYPVIGGPIADLIFTPAANNPTINLSPLSQTAPELIHFAAAIQAVDSNQQQIIDRFLLVSWLTLHAKELPKLKPHTLFELSRHLDRLFDKNQSDSLKKLLYPENQPSALYQFFAIPLTYVTGLIRLIIAPFISIVAAVRGKSLPLEPMKRAAVDLFDKIKHDLSRLLVFGTHLGSAVFMALATPIKSCAMLVTMIVGRIASLFNSNSGHAMHKFFASVHAFINTAIEWLYPARAIKSVSIANPVHTVNEVRGSYNSLLTQMDTAAKTRLDPEPSSPNPESTPLSFWQTREASAQANEETSSSMPKIV